MESMENPEQETQEILRWHYQADLVTRTDGQETVMFQNMLSWKINQR